MLAIARNNHINLTFRNTKRLAVHQAVPITATLSWWWGLRLPLSMWFVSMWFVSMWFVSMWFDSLALKPLLAGAKTRLRACSQSIISIDCLLSGISHHWESQPTLKFFLYNYYCSTLTAVKIAYSRFLNHRNDHINNSSLHSPVRL
ncbi:hypothetical protein BJP37_15970 [Moorena bouillonii PNG]|uniref:Uncharacterized protein n=1 Tax=Moorena bouillonii PNG TaxID=568701 RepID=A0A1U7N2X4_9CYAN|nr:hypothetical protein BJP37_15970 [Moorena bouillonii PNG]